MAQPARLAEVRAEHLLTDMLVAQGWDVRRPPAGDLLRQQEYRDVMHLLEAFRGQSKTGRGGDGLPEAVVVDRVTLQPLIVVEAKSSASDLKKAEAEAIHYGRACLALGQTPLVAALAGTEEDNFKLHVYKWTGNDWVLVTYEGEPISWIPNRADVERLLPLGSPSELRPTVPPAEVLAQRADEINRLLRESGIQDQFRPGVVGAIMLALWQSRGDLRKSPEHILGDINSACEKAFWKAKKPELQKSLHVPEDNERLAVHSRRIVTILERLNVHVLTAEHDYLGQLYETFFRYTGGNTIGQYFTPRHIANFMAELTEVGPQDIVLDISCGTGGFLVAAMNRVLVRKRLSRAQLVELVKHKLIGIETVPMTAAICVANMILRGDGSTGIHNKDAFTWKGFPANRATIALLNPPFPHRKTDRPPEHFVDRALEGVRAGGEVAVIVPTSLLVRREKGKWREALLKRHTLEAAIGLPDELFEPFASSYTTVLLIKKGLPHRADRDVFYARITNDGLRIRKSARVPIEGEQLTAVLDAYRTHKTIAGLCGWGKAGTVWGAGLYVPSRPLTEHELVRGVAGTIRERSAFVVRQAPSLVRFRRYLAERTTPLAQPRQRAFGDTPGTIGAHFLIGYGQKSLHNKTHLRRGPCLIIAASARDNGSYGFFDFEDLLQPPFVTATSTGTPGEARVQELPCGVADDCLILTPKPGTPRELLYVAAAMIQSEQWRFNYGMKMTPARIAEYPIEVSPERLAWIREYLAQAAGVEAAALLVAEDEEDREIAHRRIAETEKHPETVLRGEELARRLEALI
jgi:type I restriction enzyme M protein